MAAMAATFVREFDVPELKSAERDREERRRRHEDWAEGYKARKAERERLKLERDRPIIEAAEAKRARKNAKRLANL